MRESTFHFNRKKVGSLSRKNDNIYKNEDFVFSKSVFENRFWTFINVQNPVYLQGLENTIFLVW
jgi:hypothetical protein